MVYTYFVSYKFADNGNRTAGFGSSEIIRDSLITTYQHLKDTIQIIDNGEDITNVVIDNFILLSKEEN